MTFRELLGLVTASAAAGAVVWRIVRWCGRIVEGLRCQLRTDMLAVYYQHREDRTIRPYELQNFEANYAAYRALRGNSFIHKVREEVQTWEIRA